MACATELMRLNVLKKTGVAISSVQGDIVRRISLGNFPVANCIEILLGLRDNGLNKIISEGIGELGFNNVLC